MSVAGLKSHFLNWREWEFNPIVIKELRQAVRSWAVTGMLLLLLTVLFITSLIFLITNLFENDANLGLGGTMFSAFMAILGGASFLFIPLYVGVRLSSERQENNPDLLYVSTLSPGRIIRGKFFCGAYMAVLFFSACMPFMAFTNLLRGVDLPTVLFILAFFFLTICAANMVAIFLACLPVSRPFKVLLALGGLILCCTTIIPMIAASFEFMRSGVGTMLFGHNFWWGVLSFIFVLLLMVGLFYHLAVALISPPSANRALPIRLFLTAVWVASLLIDYVWIKAAHSPGIATVDAYSTLVIMIFALLVIISNRDDLSLRVQRTIPRSPLKRAGAFLLYNGAAGGLVWAALILGGTYFFMKWEFVASSGSGMPYSRMPYSPGFHAPVPWADAATQDFLIEVAYAFSYALLALFLHRTLLGRRHPKTAGLMAVLLPSAWAVTPGIVLFFLNKLSWTNVNNIPLGNPFSIFTLRDEGPRLDHLWFSFAFFLVMVLLNLRWFSRQWAKFRPPPAVAPPTLG
jgi:hypothetical protein